MNKCINVTPEIERAFNKTRDSFRMTGVTSVLLYYMCNSIVKDLLYLTYIVHDIRNAIIYDAKQ